MDKKKEWIQAINLGKYFAFILSTIFVIIFQFTSNSVLVKLALVSYVAAFALTFTALVIHACEIYNAGKEAKKDKATVVKPEQFDQGTVVIDQGELQGEVAEVVNLKHEQIWTVIGAIAAGIFAIFTFVVLFLY